MSLAKLHAAWETEVDSIEMNILAAIGNLIPDVETENRIIYMREIANLTGYNELFIYQTLSKLAIDRQDIVKSVVGNYVVA